MHNSDFIPYLTSKSLISNEIPNSQNILLQKKTFFQVLNTVIPLYINLEHEFFI